MVSISVLLSFLSISRSLTAFAQRVDDLCTDTRSGCDLFSFVTQPDIRAPRWKVTKHRPSLINDGYWFVAPYTEWDTVPGRHEYIPAQVGPHIYDGDGNLVWSGASLVNNRNTFDFRTFQANGSTFLSCILHKSDREEDEEHHGMGIFLDTSYRERGRAVHEIGWEFNLHEFQIQEDGKQALIFSSNRQRVQDSATNQAGFVFYDCLHEFDLSSNSFEYTFCPLDSGVTLDESSTQHPDLNETTESTAWDFFHANSIDRFQNGDYLVSARHASTIYRFNRADKSIVWRVGGVLSDFTMDFDFSSQHHATILAEDTDSTQILFLDNASDDGERQPDTAWSSTVKMLMLNTTTMEARLVNEWRRPDGELTRKRGSAEILPNGNIFAAWSDSGYMSEHTQDNDLVLEARFLSSRYATYRAFKAPFIGNPIEPPAIESFVTVSQTESNYHMTTTFVSWNGATEVESWKFFGLQDAMAGTGGFMLIGSTPKTGFETAFSEKGAWRFVYVEAVAANGSTIGKSDVRTPRFLSASTFTGLTAGPWPGAAGSRSSTPSSYVETKLHQTTAALATVMILLALQSVGIVAYLIVHISLRRSRWQGHASSTTGGSEGKGRSRSSSRERDHSTSSEDRVQLLSKEE